MEMLLFPIRKCVVERQQAVLPVRVETRLSPQLRVPAVLIRKCDCLLEPLPGLRCAIPGPWLGACGFFGHGRCDLIATALS